MRSFLKLVMTAAFAAAFHLCNLSLVPAQQANQLDQLTKQIGEFRKAGKYSEAIPLAQRILSLRERELGADHPSVATALSDLAMLYYQAGRYGEAEPLYQRASAIYEKALGPLMFCS